MKPSRHQVDLVNSMIYSIGDNEILSDVVIAGAMFIAYSVSQADDAIQLDELCALLMRTVTEYVENINKTKESRQAMTRWRAQYGEKYYTILGYLFVDYNLEDNFSADDKLYESGNYFRTREEAEAVAEKLRAILVEHYKQKGGKE